MTREISPLMFTTDYVGEPGKRSFFLQARSEDGLFTIAVEKAQVAALAEKLGEILVLVDRQDPVAQGQPLRDPTLTPTPTTPEWRAGSIALAYDESLDLVAVLLEPFEAGEDDPIVLEPTQDPLRVMLRRDQARAFVLHALSVVAEGRPLCQLCGLPMDPDGHRCPASNGHHAQV